MPVFNVYPHGHPVAAAPDLLAAVGLLLPVEINIPQALADNLQSQGQTLPQVVTGGALVDTGASCCCVEESLLVGLGLQPIDQVPMTGATGTRVQNVYLAKLSFPNSPIPPLEIRVIGAQMSASNLACLVGRDLLRHCLLIYNGPMGSYTLSF